MAQSMGAVRPSNLVLPQLAVSSFSGSGQASVVGQLVQQDLMLADIASKPTNAAAVAAAMEQDRKTASVNVDAWASAGINYVVRGSYTGSEGQAELYDIASKQRVLGKSYSGSGASSAAALAHKIADDIMLELTKSPGIFSSQVCFLLERGRNKEVGVADADGAGLRQLTSENAIVASPCFGKGGTEVYYTSYRDNNPDLYGMTLSGSRFEISRRPGLNTAPSWSEASGRLAVSLSKDGNCEIYSMTRNGGGLARLTTSPDADTAPDWSPDGSQIAFTSDRDGTPQIFVMDSSGGGEHRLTSGGYFDSPSWSPDGKKIAYVAREGGEFNIYYANLGGGPAVQLTRGQRDNDSPTWGPDSKHIIFSSNRGGGRDLYLMNVDTKVAHQITHGAGASSPSWGPLAK